MSLKKIKFILILLFLLSSLILTFQPTLLSAQGLWDNIKGELEPTGERAYGIQGEPRPLPVAMIRVASIILTVLAILFIIYLIYGGYLWLTAAGNEEQMEKAKRVIKAAIIGIILMFISASITLFVGRALICAIQDYQSLEWCMRYSFFP